MGVIDGQAVNQAITNPAFINKNVDDVMPNKLGFNRVGSGSSIADIQAAVNKLYTATGASESQSGTVYNATPNTISNGDSYQTAFTKLADKFDPATGHNHDGTAGMGPPISASDLGSVPLLGYLEQGTTFSAGTGTFSDVTSLLVGKTASSSPTVTGICVTSPQNKVRMMSATGSDAYQDILDGGGNLVYGRITATAATGGTWTLSYFSEQSALETPYSFAATGGTPLLWWYQELFNPLDTPPVYNPTMQMFAPGNAGGSGVSSIAASGGTPLTGAVTLSAGAGIALIEAGQNIEIENTGSAPIAPTRQIFTADIYTFTVTSANATQGDTYTNNGQTFTVLGTIVGGTNLVTSGTGAPTTSGTLTKSAGAGDATITFSSFWGSPSSGTYTRPTPAPLYIRITMIGGGGGGAGGGQITGGGSPGGDGGDGNDTTFGSSFLLAGKGGRGFHNGPGGPGGTFTINSPTIGIGINGGGGGAGDFISGDPSGGGGVGGSSAVGGGGFGDGDNTNPGGSGAVNSGGGGGGGSVASLATLATGFSSGSGGGAGAYINVTINSPSASYSYLVGAGGSAGSAGTRATGGGSGAGGIIIVEEYYQ